MSVLATPRLLVGRRIVAVEMHPFEDVSAGGKVRRTCYNPVFILDNGARVYFTVDETDAGDCYGVSPRYTNPTTRKQK